MQEGKIKTSIVTISAIVLTTAITSFFVIASDELLRDASELAKKETSLCEVGMVHVSTSNGGFCIDEFENSSSKNCIYADPENSDETLINMQRENCIPESKKNATPWVYVKQHEAESLCRKAGKRLPSNQEWYQASLGTPDTKESANRQTCNTSSNNGSKSGFYEGCISSVGAFDMIGNVWEWTNEMAEDGAFDGRTLPKSGYVASVDVRGIAIQTSDVSDLSFNEDYFSIDSVGVKGILRGGFYQSDTDAGSYAANMSIPLGTAGAAIGFRCVK